MEGLLFQQNCCKGMFCLTVKVGGWVWWYSKICSNFSGICKSRHSCWGSSWELSSCPSSEGSFTRTFLAQIVWDAKLVEQMSPNYEQIPILTLLTWHWYGMCTNIPGKINITMFNGTWSYILMRWMSVDSARRWLLNVVVPEGLLLAVTCVLAFFFAEGKNGVLLASVKFSKDVVHHLAASSIC